VFTVVITTANDERACYLTYFSLRSQLDRFGDDIEYVIVADQGTEMKWEKEPGTRCLRVNMGSPQGSRDCGIKAAEFDDVLVIESHVIAKDVIELLNVHRYASAALTFPYRTAESPEMFEVFDCETDWLGNLWYKRLLYQPRRSATPYPVSQFGHSCFFIDKKWYVESGGYSNVIRGWGGEEPFLCLKAWMTGRSCWIAPSIWQAHHLEVGAHAGRTSEKEFARNMLAVAFVLGGQPQLEICQRMYPGVSLLPTADLREERERICKGPFGGDLNKLREYFRVEGIN
jgi:hypothetical protein